MSDALRLIASFAVAIYQGAVIARGEPAFFSWYDGWGTHRVWGLGYVTESYDNASVKCGDQRIQVKPIYDTHAAHGQPPKKEQSSAFARTHNIKLSEELKQKGMHCAFRQPERTK